QTALSTQTEQAFPPDPAQRRTTLLNAAARAATEDIIGWLPADLLWLYTEKGSQARQDLNITVTRAGIIRNFTTRRIVGSGVQPFIRNLRKRGTEWYTSKGGRISMTFLRGADRSLPYVLYAPTTATGLNHRFQYENPEALLGHLAEDCVLKGLSPDTRFVLTMSTGTGFATDDARELAWNVAVQHGHTVDFSTVNSRLSQTTSGKSSFGLETPDGVFWTAQQLQQRWERVTPQQAEEAGYGLVQELLGEAVRNKPAFLARIRRSLVRWTGEATTGTETRSLSLERLDRLAEHMMPERVRNAFDGIFHADTDRRRQILLDAAVRAAEDGVAGWLPADLLWLYTKQGVQARAELKVTVTQVGIVRNFSAGKVPKLRLGIRTLHTHGRKWLTNKNSETADPNFFLGVNGSLPYLLYGPAHTVKAVPGARYRFPYVNPGKLLEWLERDSLFKALAPDAHLVLAMWADTNVSRDGLRALARNAADKFHRVVDLSTANVRISSREKGTSWLGLEMPNGPAWTAQEILHQWTCELPAGHAQPGTGLLAGAAHGPASNRTETAAIPALHAAVAGDDLTVGDAMDIDSADEEGNNGAVVGPPGREGLAAEPETTLPSFSLDHLLGQVVERKVALSRDSATIEAIRQLVAALEARRQKTPEPALNPLALRILDQLTQRALTDRALTALFTGTEHAFPSDTAQRRTVLLDAVARAAEEGVTEWLPADLLWLYTTPGVEARKDLNVTVTRAGILRNFSTVSIEYLLPGIRSLRKTPNGHWYAPRGKSSAMADAAFLLGDKGSFPYVLYGPVTATNKDHLFRYENLDDFLRWLDGDRVLKALAPDAHLFLAMSVDGDILEWGVRELAYEAAAVHGRVVDYSTVNVRLSEKYRGGRCWLGLEMPDGQSSSDKMILQHFTVVTPQQAEQAGDRLVRGLLREAAGEIEPPLATVRSSLLRWVGVAADGSDTDSRVGERLDRLVERMLPEHVQSAFGGAFPVDTDQRREVLRGAVVRAVEEGVAGWLPA
ncbi:hypothetical protein ACIP10_37150, partial [Streptomyces galbus]|uniref:hypothetical protein n=1 Tax=Streptomyces galbus TaxID=33898 RepID=UPI003812BAFF